MRHQLNNAWMFFVLAITFLVMRVHGLRYPQTTQVEHGLAFEDFDYDIAALCRERLNHSKANKTLQHMKWMPLVAVASVESDRMVVNLYRRVKNNGEMDFVRLAQPLQRQYAMVHHRGKWSQVRGGHTRFSSHGFLYNDPILTLKLRFSDNEKRFIQDRRKQEILIDESEYVF